MDNFEEVRKLGELVEAMDANPEAFANAEPVIKTEVGVEQEQVVDPEVQEDLAGGLSDALEAEEDATVTVDDILGLGGRGSSPAEEQAPDASEATEEAVEPKPSGVDDRFAEMSKDNRELREKVDILTKRALQEPATATGDDPAVEQASELNGEVKDYMDPYIDERNAPLLAELAELREATAPLMKEKNDRMMGEAIAKHAEGFDAKNIQSLYTELDGMSDEEKAVYGESFGGAVALASLMVNRGAFADGKKKQTTSKLAARHHSETSGPAPSESSEMSDEQKLKKLMDMPGPDFLAQLEKMDLG